MLLDIETIHTVKDLKDLLEAFDDDERVVIQMIDGEYDMVGFIDTVSYKGDDYRNIYLPEEYDDCVMLISTRSHISSQY